ncbi:low-specificity L-threonine aldolase [Deinococcus misasensis]|uniref:low-specificity L-threonine aldolase n=1 Tax=Deinococcus misasensis TaxID=392413 RepID=UPI000555C101|nr:low-specificity L-threonine aldolase [Deinococcus misasensis]
MLVDLRSDTVTRPTPEMLQAMLEAPVGDDVYGEDPTVNLLQEEAARLLGFEAALFMPSGTMTNQVAIATHTKRGQEVITQQGAHIYEYELGMMATFSGVVPRFVAAPLGIPDPADIRKAIGRSIHKSPTGLISLENTHNVAGGTVVPLDVLKGVREVSLSEGLPMHVDGARLMNAAVALGVDVKEITQHFDSVSLCLSKGLGAPVGSVLAGSRAFIKEAHRYRKMMGGGMRQAGILAAAARLALSQGPARLAEDHRKTRVLAEALVAAGYGVNMEAVQTNIIYAQVPDAFQKVEELKSKGILANALYADSLRVVLHHQITQEMLDHTIANL